MKSSQMPNRRGARTWPRTTSAPSSGSAISGHMTNETPISHQRGIRPTIANACHPRGRTYSRGTRMSIASAGTLNMPPPQVAVAPEERPREGEHGAPHGAGHVAPPGLVGPHALAAVREAQGVPADAVLAAHLDRPVGERRHVDLLAQGAHRPRDLAGRPAQRPREPHALLARPPARAGRRG